MFKQVQINNKRVDREPYTWDLTKVSNKTNLFEFLLRFRVNYNTRA